MASTANLTLESTEELSKNDKTEENENKFKKLPFKEKISYIRNVVTVEPLLGCYIMPAIIASLAIQNMTIELACRVNLDYNHTICDDLLSSETSNHTSEEVEVQKLVASMLPWKTPLQSAIPAILILFLGSYSDRHKIRKPFLIMPLIGEIVSTVLFFFCATYKNSWPMEVLGVSEALFPALSGGSTTMLMAVYAYIADVSTIEMRTLRIGIVHLVSAILFPIGSSISGILYETIGYYGIFSISIVLYIIALYYGIFRIVEPKKPVLNKNKHFCADFFDPKHVVDTFSIIYKKRDGSRRVRIVLLLLVFIVIIGPTSGEATLSYLYTRTKFNWDAVQFSLYLTYDVIIHFIGSTLAIVVLSQWLKLDDLLLAALACVCKVAASFLYAFSETPTLFYFAPIVSLISGAGSIAMRSIATKIVPPDELGKIQSLFGICDAIAPIVYTALYSRVYIATIETLPGAYFLLGAVLIFPSIIIFLGMYFLQENDKRKAIEAEKEKEQDMFKYTIPISEI